MRRTSAGVFDEVTSARAAMSRRSSPGAGRCGRHDARPGAGRLFAVAEAYPDLKASQNFQQLQAELTDTEDKIASARRYYNATVQAYNTGDPDVPVAALRRAVRVPGAGVLRGRAGRARACRRELPVVARVRVTLQQQIRPTACGRRSSSSCSRPHRSRRRCLVSLDRGGRGGRAARIRARVRALRLVERRPPDRRPHPRRAAQQGRRPRAVPARRERLDRGGTARDAAHLSRRRPSAERLRRGLAARVDLRRGHDRAAAADAATRARGGARPRDLPHPQPRRAADDARSGARRSDRDDQRLRLPDRVLRRRPRKPGPQSAADRSPRSSPSCSRRWRR